MAALTMASAAFVTGGMLARLRRNRFGLFDGQRAARGGVNTRLVSRRNLQPGRALVEGISVISNRMSGNTTSVDRLGTHCPLLLYGC